MLRDLHIENLALIDDLWLEFDSGLSVLTGETGTGKTVLLSALELVMGGRGDSGSIAPDSASAKVQAVFDSNNAASKLGDDNSANDDSAEIIVSRTMNTSGRTRVLLNGELSTVGALQKQVGCLIDLHGQHDHQALLSPARHIEYLDRWASASVQPLHDAYVASREQWQESREELSQVQVLIAQSAEQSEAGRIALAEIERIDPHPGEDDALRASLPTLQNSEQIAELMGQAQHALRGEKAALDNLYSLDVALEQVITFDHSATEMREAAREARGMLEGLADLIGDYLASIEHDPRALEEAFERLSMLEGLAKRYGPTLDAVFARRDHLLSVVDVGENSEIRLQEAQRAEEKAQKQLRDAAEALSKARHVAAADFITQLSNAAKDLELGKVRFDVDFKELPFEQWTAAGSNHIEILYAPAPAMPARPLAKIASGGEISRVMLALKSVLGSADNTAILVFDEVDAGIGGATGLAIGAKLKNLAQTHQVIVVTHLAQVAVYADHHFKVSKEIDGDTVKTRVATLSGTERTAEIARMLSGSDSETALQHATELLQNALNG